MTESDSDADLLDDLIKRAQEGTADHLDRRMREAEKIKRQEEQASQRRLEEMWEKEHERQREIAEAQAETRRQEQMLVRYVLIGAAIVILIVLLLTIGLGLLA
jgi:CHASE3 domain sensor protein